MKKNYLLIGLIALFTLLPIKVNAAYAEFSNPKISCNNVSTGETSTCNIYVTNSGDETLTIIDIKVRGDSGLSLSTTNPAPIQTSIPTGEAGNNVKIGTFTATASTAGSYNISFDSLNIESADSSTAASGGITGVSTTLKVLNSVAGLSNLTIDGATVSGFDTDKRSYSASVSKSSVTIGADPISGGSIQSGTGTINLSCGNNTANVETKSEDGKTSKTYAITITRNCNSDISLSGITLSSGTLSPKFSANTTSYSVEVDSSVSRISITPKKNNDTQTVTSIYDKSVNYGENKFSITVTAESGATRTYSFTVTRKDDRSTDATLKNIELSDGKIDFDANKTEYEFKVLYDVDKIIVTPTTNNEKAKFEVTGADALVVGENTITIKVKAENETEKVYTIKVTRLKEGEDLGDDPSIKTFSITGYEFNFRSNTYNYTLKIKNEKVLDMKVIMNQESASYSIVGNSNLKDGSVIIIKTSSEDGSNLTYKITIQKDSNLWIWILIILAVIIIIVGIIIFVIRKTKNKDKKISSTIAKDEISDVEKVKKTADPNKEEIKVVKTTKVISDNDLLKKVESQIKSVESETEKKPITINNTIDKSEMLSNEELSGLGEAKKENIIKPISIITREKNEESNKEIETEIEQKEKKMNYRSERFAPSEEESSAPATKICSICGHKVPKDAKVCPYCRRVWK